MRGHNSRRASVHELPIPPDSAVNDSWTPQMVEIADVIGPLATLQLVDALGGTDLRVPREPKPEGAIAQAIGVRKARDFCAAFAGEMMTLPVAEAALARARRRPVLADVRAGRLNKTQAALMLRTSRSRVAYLVNQKREDLAACEPQRGGRAVRQLDMFTADD